MKLKNKIGIIGAGVMGSIFIEYLVKSKTVSRSQIIVADHADDKKTLVDKSQILILAVKPQDFKKLSQELRKTNLNDSHIIISIMAGIDIKTIQKSLGVKKVIRAMPNLPAKIGQSITVWKSSSQVLQKEKRYVKKVLKSLGTEIEVDKERLIDFSTAVSGSGPAYVFLFQELIMAAAQDLGMSKDLSYKLVNETFRGSINLQKELNISPEKLRKQVTSKKGTTASALEVFKKNKVDKIFKKAILSAFNRSQELKKQL